MLRNHATILSQISKHGKSKVVAGNHNDEVIGEVVDGVDLVTGVVVDKADQVVDVVVDGDGKVAGVDMDRVGQVVVCRFVEEVDVEGGEGAATCRT